MTRPRTHYAAEDARETGLTVALCGHLPRSRDATRDERAVTCRRCLAALAKRPPVPPVAEPAWTPPPPRESTSRTWDDRLRAIAEAEVPAAGPRRRYPFGGVSAALKLWATCRVDGYRSRSTAGPLAEIGRVGALVQTSGRAEPRSLRDADLVAGVNQALEAVFGVSWSGELDARAARDALLACEVGEPASVNVRADRGTRAFVPRSSAEVAAALGVPRPLVTDALRRAKRLLRVELAARDLMPTPSYLAVTVQARREERMA